MLAKVRLGQQLYFVKIILHQFYYLITHFYNNEV